MNDDLSFGQLIQRRRQELNLTQRETAKRVTDRLKQEDRRGFDFTYLSKIENGRMPPPSAPAIRHLAAVLEMDPDELLAAAGKVPKDVGETLMSSPGARAFFRSAADGNLSEDEWRRLIEEIKRKKPE